MNPLIHIRSPNVHYPHLYLSSTPLQAPRHRPKRNRLGAIKQDRPIPVNELYQSFLGIRDESLKLRLTKLCLVSYSSDCPTITQVCWCGPRVGNAKGVGVKGRLIVSPV